ncbi:MAG: DUF2059 domain-containing protein [Bacteroidia bacterium]|nr:DUF2059 domain-containing protein [Bacteroidia bacterium]NNF85471.1 DUF2059 domain-containing protein [Winogradskyella sp.]NNL82490.1 DUF2059 domain-containing protein [Winogradskyella sp.]
MKKILLICLITLSTQLFAQDQDSFKTDAVEFIKLTGSASAFQSAIEQIGAMVPEDKKEAYLIEAEATLEGLYEDIAELYMREFTHDEIKELIQFYNTDLGKKLATKQLSLSQQGMMLGQSWGMEVQQIAQKHSN